MPVDRVREVGDRIEALLDQLRGSGDAVAAERAEELVRLLMELYGAGLERVLDLLAGGPDGGTEAIGRLADDALVASLLVLHGLHPVPLEERVHEALETVRPYLGSHAGGVELLGIDDDAVVHLRLQGSCDGCASSTLTVKHAIEQAIREAAPEIVDVEAEGIAEAPTAPGLHQIGARPSSWTRVDGLSLLPGQLSAVAVEGQQLVVCSIAGSLYAYRDACAACSSALREGRLDGDRLACPACGATFDARLAGRRVDADGSPLTPVPLLPGDGAFRVAVGQGAPA